MPNALTACLYYLKSRQDKVTGISFVDSTAIPDRSLPNFMLNLITALIAYTHQPKKPSLNLDKSAQDFFSIVPL